MNLLLTLRRRVTTIAIIVLISSNILKAGAETNSPLQSTGSAQSTLANHFQPVWWGENGYGHMNINITSVKLNNEFLGVNDEIAVYNGSICVGAIKLTSSSDNIILNIIASQNDGTGNGFTQGDSIIFRIWDSKSAKEVTSIRANYLSTLATWLSSGKYGANESSFLTLDAKSTKQQEILLTTGWNTISTNLIPESTNMLTLLNELTQAEQLVKVVDEAGKTIENWGEFGSWQNNIGSHAITEGYKIRVSTDCSLSIQGVSIDIPTTIDLKKGWNIIAYPLDFQVDGKKVVQGLIDNGSLEKVMDERGFSIEDFGAFGGWKNTIGNFIPGEGYEIKVNRDVTLTISNTFTKSQEIVFMEQPTNYYYPAYEGNGTNHMSINIHSFESLNLKDGDEIGVFDGDICTGSTKITPEILQSGIIIIRASKANSNELDGFTDGNPISLKKWDSWTNEESDLIITDIQNEILFSANESAFIGATINNTPIQNTLYTKNNLSVFPNPSNGIFNIKFTVNTTAPSNITVFDTNGRLVYQNSMVENSSSVDLTHLSKGVYYLNNRLNNELFRTKIVIQ